MESYQNLDNLRETERIRYQIQQEITLTSKSPFLAVLFSMFIPGMGQVYAHNFIKGFLWFSFFLVLSSLNFGIKEFVLSATPSLNIFISLSHIFIWLFIIHDAYKTARLYNIGRINTLNRQTLISLISMEAILIIILSDIIRTL